MIKRGEFLDLTDKYNLIPVYKEIIVDTETPVSLYRRLSDLNDYSFLLESANNKSNMGRYSFIGIAPKRIIKKSSENIKILNSNGKKIKEEKDRDFVSFLNNYLESFKVYNTEYLPPFSGGLVGYFDYELVSSWKDLYHQQPDKKLQKSELAESVLVIAKLIVAYDHLKNTIKIIDNIEIDNKFNQEEKIKKYQKAEERIDRIIKMIRNRDKNNFSSHRRENNIVTENLVSNTEKKDFEKMVEKAKQYIINGEVFQLVLSQKFSVKTGLSPFQVYRALRVSNPSPYLFYLNFPEIKLVGSSPEVLVRVQGEKVITRPLAGTRRRGQTRLEDKRLQEDLLADEKEKAEHIMLVDLGRNDLGRVCEVNSIKITELLGVERFSQVMHIVSQVEGVKKPELSSLEVLKSVFPAGTVSGAPKIRAMELIDELEKEPRGVYAGAVGYLDFKGNLDTCIAIRTFSMQNGILSAQVGAGIVSDSKPEKEYKETLNKGRALFQALEITNKEEPYGLSN